MAVNISLTYDRFSLPLGPLRSRAAAIGAKDTDRQEAATVVQTETFRGPRK